MGVYGPIRHQKNIIWTEASWWRTGPYTAIWPSVPWTICYIINVCNRPHCHQTPCNTCHLFYLIRLYLKSNLSDLIKLDLIDLLQPEKNCELVLVLNYTYILVFIWPVDEIMTIGVNRFNSATYTDRQKLSINLIYLDLIWYCVYEY